MKGWVLTQLKHVLVKTWLQLINYWPGNVESWRGPPWFTVLGVSRVGLEQGELQMKEPYWLKIIMVLSLSRFCI